jgi:hypothetical protein
MKLYCCLFACVQSHCCTASSNALLSVDARQSPSVMMTRHAPVAVAQPGRAVRGAGLDDVVDPPQPGGVLKAHQQPHVLGDLAQDGRTQRPCKSCRSTC